MAVHGDPPVRQQPDTRRYNQKGDVFALDPVPADNGRARPAAEWRLASFALILPLPEDGLIRDEGIEAASMLELSDAWFTGRYEGIREVEFLRENGGIASLRCYYSRARDRLGPLIGRAVGDSEIDDSAVDRLGNSAMHHLLLDPEDDGNCFRILEDDVPGPARLCLRSVELLQYAEADADPDRHLVHRFLVLHVVAENCSSATIEAVSQALHRPRGKLRVEQIEDPAGEETRGDPWVSPMDKFCKIALDKLSTGVTNAKTRLALERGGYLSSNGPKDGASGSRVWRTPVPPQRVVLALPGSAVESSPALLDHPGTDHWTPPEKWGWVLASGADRYAEAFPAETEAVAQRSRCGDHRSWTVWAGEFGLSIVRHRTDEPSGEGYLGETKFLQLAQTSYVDLAVLTMRAFQTLSAFSSDLAHIDQLVERELRKETLERPVLNAADAREQDRERLRLKLRELERVQSDFVVFRERLWFAGVPRHDVDSRIMLTLRRTCGVDRLLEEFTQELTLRREVYSTQYTAREVEDSRVRAETAREEQAQREQDREAAQRERDAQEAQRSAAREAMEQRSERLNQLLAVAAVAFAVPAVVEAFGLWDSVVAGIVVLGLIIGLAVLGAMAIGRWTRRHAMRRSTARESEKDVAHAAASGMR